MNTPKESDLQREFREFAEASERYRTELARDPMQAAMLKAMAPTKAEAAELEAVQAAVVEAEAAVNNAAAALLRAEEARPAAPSGFDFFRKSRRAAVAAVSIPALKVDLHEARSMLQAAIRRRNEAAARIDQARMDRRSQAKLKFAPKREKPISRNAQGRVLIIDRSEAA